MKHTLIYEQAIRHARKEWGVHMISLSFGMDKSVQSVRDEITKCIKNDIVVFAAASNDGANSPRTYPATHPGVLCINSATGEGNKSSFNPNPTEGEDNFSVVGDCVKSSWPVSKANKSGKKYMSGTSFATPVAVAIAASMIGYIKKEIGASAWGLEPTSPDGVRKLFRLMKIKREDYDFVSPARFFKDCGDDEGLVKGLIKRELKI